MATALASVRLWDGTSGALSAERLHVRIEGERIAAIGRDPSLLASARVLELGLEAVALPGLIDAHVHLTLDPELDSPDEQLAREDDRILREMKSRALAMARAGITTARDLGAGRWLELGLRDRIARGEVPGPRLLCAGQPVTRPLGHCHFWGGTVDGANTIEAVVERQLERGVDLIKVMATGGNITPGSDPRKAQFSVEELTRVRARAEHAGRFVAAHCHATAGIRNAAAARVRTIEHCSFMADPDAAPPAAGEELAELGPVCKAIAGSGVFVSPTINAGWVRFKRNKQGDVSGFFRAKRAIFRNLREAGARLVASTDAGIPRVVHDGLARALPVFADYAELSALEVLRSATSTSAEALGLDGVTGRLVRGYEADVLVVRGDPLEDLSVLERPLAVFTRGRAVPGAGASGSGARSA